MPERDSRGRFVATAAVGLEPSAQGFGSKLTRAIGGDLDKAGREGGRRFGLGMRTTLQAGATRIFSPLIAAAGALAVGNFIGDAIGEARESQKVGAVTTQIIKSTGSAAKITAGQVGDLATAISNKTGIDDEAIQSGSNLLLTFKNVRNEAGKGNQIFNRATQAAVDLSKAGFGSIEGASKMLGKALNDPVKGISALGRAGVTFTDQQKKQIKTLVKSGKTLDAQKIIMREVESQVGGVAEKSATAGEKLSVAFGNFKEQIGTALLPILDKVFGFLSGSVLPAVSGFFSELQSGSGVGGTVATVFSKIFNGAKALFDLVVKGDFTSAFRNVFGLEEDSPIVGTILTIRDGLTGLFNLLVKGDFTGALRRAFGFEEDSPIVGTILKLRDTFFSAFGAVRDFIVTKVVPAFMGIVGAVQGFVATAIPIIAGFVAGMMQRIAPLMPQIRAIFGTIGQIITGAMALIQAVIQRVTSVISWIWTNWGNGIMNFLASVWSGIIGIVGPALEGIRSIIATVTALIRGDWSGAWEGIKGIVAAIFNTIKGIVSGALGILGTLFLGAMTKIGDAVNNGLTAVVRFIVGGMTRFGDAVNSGITTVITWFQELPGKIVGAIAGLGAQLFDAGVNVVGGFIRGLISKAGEIISVVRDKIVGVLPDFVKDFLGIHSPSRVFMKLGQQTAAGMAVGLEAGARDVQKAAGSLIPSLSASRYSVGVTASGDAAAGYARRMHPADIADLAYAMANIRPEVRIRTLDSDLVRRRSR